ncbi:hypothetical protein [Caldinitratiruptor microaerophilus]|uniref:Uncharacterized protein n=1 Tax=Caldinitratiruptor microaerophilus TaxID=671077 RepID=A0AA35CLT8_9FIRM|nr:hypothetical protein [Caldinitratiruptor microaerophilus]BDG61694.1 hypothetical protein caldi_27840 [Caldinitratiruptor microaerophilus]
MNVLDKVVLLGTGLIAIYVIWRLYRDLRSGLRAGRAPVYYLASFAVLLAAGLLLIGLGYGVLGNPLVVVVASLIPATLSLGLVTEFFPRYEKPYAAFAIVGLLGIALTRVSGPSGLATLVLAVVHAVAGLLIVALPVLAGLTGRAPRGFLWVGLGGVLIGIGGIALAFLKAGLPILPASFIFSILAPLLLFMTACFAQGFLSTPRR